MQTNTPAAPVDALNLAQIARLAGVGRAAVVHWRRRSPDFPPPVGGTDISPLFDRQAAEAWVASCPLVAAARERRIQTLREQVFFEDDPWARHRLADELAGQRPAEVRVWPPLIRGSL